MYTFFTKKLLSFLTFSWRDNWRLTISCKRQKHISINSLFLNLLLIIFLSHLLNIAKAIQTNVASIHTDGTQGNGIIFSQSISGNGKFIAFTSNATNLVSENIENMQVYLRDIESGTTTLITRSYDNLSHANPSFYGVHQIALSHDGCQIAFISMADNLVVGDTNDGYDIFMYDCSLDDPSFPNKIKRISIGPNGEQGFYLNQNTHVERGLDISDDGRFVVFNYNLPQISPLVSNDNYVPLIYLHDRLADAGSGATNLIVFNADGSIPTGEHGYHTPHISPDGSSISFSSILNNIEPNHPNFFKNDVFVYNRVDNAYGLQGSVELVSISDDGSISGAKEPGDLSGDGRYVIFETQEQLATNDNNGITHDVYRYDRLNNQIELVSTNLNGQSGNFSSFSIFRSADISYNGQYISFFSFANDLVEPYFDIYSPDVFKKNMQTGETTLLTPGINGSPSNGSTLYNIRINSDGCITSFLSNASNLIISDTNDNYDVFYINDCLEEFDFGDAPGAQTALTDDGARHRFRGYLTSDNIFFGSNAFGYPDPDTGDVGDINAINDDSTNINDENGVMLNNNSLSNQNLTIGSTSTLSINIQETVGLNPLYGYLNVFADWNQDGLFTGTGEQLLHDVSVDTGTVTLDVTPPEGLSNNIAYLRFRACLKPNRCNTPVGSAPFGEVEDYRVNLIGNNVNDSICYKDNTPKGWFANQQVWWGGGSHQYQVSFKEGDLTWLEAGPHEKPTKVFEGFTTITTKTGEPLLHADTQKIFDMTGVSWGKIVSASEAEGSIKEGVIIIPIAESSDQLYYIFYNEHDDLRNQSNPVILPRSSIKYGIVKNTAANDQGNGWYQEPQPLSEVQRRSHEALAMIPHTNQRDYWLLTIASSLSEASDTDHPELYVYRVGPDGVILHSVESLTSALGLEFQSDRSTLEWNPSRGIIGVGLESNATSELGGLILTAKFDQTDGVIYDLEEHSEFRGRGYGYGLAFSIDGKLLYVTGGQEYDYLSGNIDVKGVSNTVRIKNLFTNEVSSVETEMLLGDPRLAYDGKLYFAQHNYPEPIITAPSSFAYWEQPDIMPTTNYSFSYIQVNYNHIFGALTLPVPIYSPCDI